MMGNGEQKTAWVTYALAGARSFEDHALAMHAQRRQADESVVVLGPEAQDSDADRARELGFHKVVRSEPGWRMGKILNAGLRAASAELAVVVSTNAVPLGPHFLGDVMHVFDAHPSVAAVRCMRVEDRSRIARWAQIQEPVSSLQDVERAVLAAPNTGCFGIRLSAWAEAGFDESLEVSVDKIWAYQALKRGHAVSASTAMFADLGEVTWSKAFRYRRRQALEFYAATGEHVRHARPSLAAALRGIFVGGPRIGARYSLNSALTYVADVVSDRRVKRSARSRGSVQPQKGEAHV